MEVSGKALGSQEVGIVIGVVHGTTRIGVKPVLDIFILKNCVEEPPSAKEAQTVHV
jgi:hypothetical protein